MDEGLLPWFCVAKHKKGLLVVDFNPVHYGESHSNPCQPRVVPFGTDAA